MDAKSLGQVAFEEFNSNWKIAGCGFELTTPEWKADWERAAQAVVAAAGAELEAMREELSATRMQLEAAQAMLRSRVDGAYMMGQIS